jgi:hypothetical protein
MQPSARIIVTEEFGKLLNTREAASELINLVSDVNSSDTEIDFTGVEFMSRSFADQFHKELEQIRLEKQQRIEILNAAEPVIRMLKAVAVTQNSTDRDYIALPVLKFTDHKLLRDYLLSL